MSAARTPNTPSARPRQRAAVAAADKETRKANHQHQNIPCTQYYAGAGAGVAAGSGALTGASDPFSTTVAAAGSAAGAAFEGAIGTSAPAGTGCSGGLAAPGLTGRGGTGLSLPDTVPASLPPLPNVLGDLIAAVSAFVADDFCLLGDACEGDPCGERGGFDVGEDAGGDDGGLTADGLRLLLSSIVRLLVVDSSSAPGRNTPRSVIT